jgi:hypothetical protein
MSTTSMTYFQLPYVMSGSIYSTKTTRGLVELICEAYDGKSPLILYQSRLYVVPKLFLQRRTKVSMIAEKSWSKEF